VAPALLPVRISLAQSEAALFECTFHPAFTIRLIFSSVRVHIPSRIHDPPDLFL
jgi:hypothetical protein